MTDASAVQVPLIVGPYMIGRLEFIRPRDLEAWRTLGGLAFVVPARVVIDGHQELKSKGLLPVVSNLRATLRHEGIEVAVARDDRIYRSYSQDAARLVARLPSTSLFALERQRNGGPVRFAVSVGGEVCTVQGNSVGQMARFDPVAIARAMYDEPVVQIEYDDRVWAEMLQRTGFGDNVVVEIPLPPSPGPPWDPVWKALRAARDALNRGGAFAWKTVVGECRVALEEWEGIEPADHGDGGLTANRAQREARTLPQRRDALRWHAHQLAHYFQHNHADECTRDDAALVLATVVGALAARKP